MKREHVILLGLMLLVAVAVRLPTIGQSLWVDEIYSANFAAHPLNGFFSNLAENDSHPPLYYLLLHAWMGLGSSDAWLRSLSVIFGVGVVGLACAAAWTIRSPQAGLIAGFFAALTPQLIELSLEVRYLALFTLLVAGTMYLLARILTARRGLWWEWLLVGALQGLAMLTFYYAALFIAGINLVLVIEALRSRGRAVPFGRLVASWTVAAVVFSPWLPFFVQQNARVGAVQEGIALSGVPAGMVRGIARLGPFHALQLALEAAHARHAMALTAVVVALLVIGALRRLVAESDEQLRARRLRWMALLLGGIGVLVVAGPLASWAKGLFFAQRYLAHGALLAVLLAAELVCILVRASTWRTVATAAVCIVFVASLPSAAYRVTEPWREAAQFVDARVEPGDLVVGLEFDPSCYAYYGHVPVTLVSLPDELPGAPARPEGDWVRALTEDDAPSLRRLFAEHERVAAIWCHTVKFGRERNVALVGRVVREMGFRVTAEHDFAGRPGIRVEVFERGARDAG